MLCAILISSSVAERPLLYPSLIQIIANPEKFDGKEVSVAGFLLIEHEGDALYFHREDYEHGLLENSIWVDTTAEMAKEKAGLNLKYVIVTGTFVARGDGLQQIEAGGITKIKRVMICPEPKERLH